MEQTPDSPTGSSATGSSPAGPSATDSSTTENVKGKVQAAAQQAKGRAQSAAQRVKSEGKQRLESGKETAADKAQQVADAVSRASDELHQQQEHGLAEYTSQVAAGISSFADTLRHRSIDDLIADTQALARRNPTIFFLSSIGVGLALSRFLKASARNAPAREGTAYPGGETETSYAAGSEWEQPEASQSIYGGQPSSPGTSGWSTQTRGSDFEVRYGESAPGEPNKPPGGAYP